MHVTDPDETPNDAAATDPAGAAAATADDGADTPSAEPGADGPEPGSQEADVAAFEAGMKADEPEPAAGEGGEDGDPEPKLGADGKPVAKTEEPDKDKPTEPSEIDKEVKERGLTGKTEERFRELANAAKEYEPVKSALDKAGVTADLVPTLIQHAKNHAEWTEIITESTAKSEQLTSALHLIQAINSDDPDVLATAYEAMEKELAMIGKRIGKAAPGYDPLAEHPDLQEEVESGMPRKHALELAQARTVKAQVDQRKQAAKQQGDQQTQAQADAVAEVQTLNAKLKAEDPANFAARVAQIDFAAIKQHPPHLWPAKIEAAYWRAQVTPAKTPVTNVPLRPGGNRPMQRQPKNDVEAFEMGVAATR